MPFWYIIYIKFLGFFDAINIKGVKLVFCYFGNVKGTPSIERNNVFKFGLKISSITYISGPNGVKKKTHISLIFSRLMICLFYWKQIFAVDNEESN